MCLISLLDVEIAFNRRISHTEGNAAIGFSLQLFHVADSDLHLRILCRKVLREACFQILFHLIQKSVIRHCHSYLLHLYLFSGNKKRRLPFVPKNDE